MSPIQPAKFEAYEAVIRSGQVPHEDVPPLLDQNPTFAEWYRARMPNRTIPSETTEG